MNIKSSGIDRISQGLRPDGRSDGTQSWRSLLFCHWEVDVDTLRPLIPDCFEIDTFDGSAFVATVPFKMQGIRPSWLPKSLAFNFFETNVRTYVVHKGQPGVYFLSLDASSRLAVWAARTGWSLPYYFAKMKSVESETQQIYESCRIDGSGAHQVAFRIGDELGESRPGTLEHFLLERYLLFVERRGQSLVGQVHHSPYVTFSAHVDQIDDELMDCAGVSGMSRLPDLAHYSPGVDVEVFGIRPT